LWGEQAMRDDLEIKLQAKNETLEHCCDNCSKLYWEACVGIHFSCYLFDRVEGCKKALDMYAERLGKLIDRE